jgi:dienelactone hydrolase
MAAPLFAQDKPKADTPAGRTQSRSKDFNVDPNRIYLMGHSMGGGGTFHIGIKNPDLFAALAPIAPAVFHKTDELEKIKHVPVILVQGDKDNLVKVERIRPWAEKMKELKMKYEYIEVPGGGHVDVAFKNLPQIFEFFDKHTKAEKPKSEIAGLESCGPDLWHGRPVLERCRVIRGSLPPFVRAFRGFRGCR